MKIWKLNVIVVALLLPILSVVVLAQTQAGMNKAACDEYTKTDAELNTIYRQVLRERQADAGFTRKMRAAQRAWIAYRDAHLAALYPAADTRREYGSVYPTCRCAALTEATRKRTEELRRWTKAAAEGDVCAGSTRAGIDDGASSGMPEYERADSIFRKRWTLTRMGERLFRSDEPYLEFNVKQGRFSGSTGCNRISGGYRVGFGAGGDDLNFTPVAVTRRACPGEQAQVEASFLKALEMSKRFQVQGDVVRLYAADSPVLIFRTDTKASAAEASDVTETASVTGTVTYRQRVALTPGAVVEVKLLDVSRADAPSVTIAEQIIKPAGRQVPIEFELRYDPRRIEQNRRYAVRARILEGVKLQFTSTQVYPVITGGNPNTVEVIVSPVR
ncbi:MAG: YbaY family lipoprotein [Acidobacteriota bacterium]|nr:YbaY family lipoprotein [Acidobacteriota bacterium]